MKIKLGYGKLSMKEICRYTHGELYDFTDDEVYITHICTDSREADEHTLFVATRGERVDGHDYIISAADLGCRCFVCEYVPSDISGKKLAFCVVENSFSAFADIALGYCGEHDMKNIAITGSVGKTTTKELLACVLREDHGVYCTSGNYNSVIGMPMSLMEADEKCKYGVFEMGMSGFSEISSMSKTARPQIAMIVNIGTSHLEYLGTRPNIAKAKLEIADGLVTGGTLLLDGDEPLLADARHILGRNDIDYVYVSARNAPFAHARAENIRLSDDGSAFDLVFDENVIRDIRLNIPGAHIVKNALFVCTAALRLGVCVDSIKRGLLKYAPVGYRQRIYEKRGIKVIADCYNASPESMHAAADVLKCIKCNGKRIAVLGDMKELGSQYAEMHREVGRHIAESADMLFTYGENARFIAGGAREKKMNDVFTFGADEEDMLCKTIMNTACMGDCVLFKASRSMMLEKIIKGSELD